MLKVPLRPPAAGDEMGCVIGTGRLLKESPPPPLFPPLVLLHLLLLGRPRSERHGLFERGIYHANLSDHACPKDQNLTTLNRMEGSHSDVYVAAGFGWREDKLLPGRVTQA